MRRQVDPAGPIRDAKRRETFRKALAEGNRRYGKMLRRLAD